MGNQSVKPRNSSVAVRAASSRTPRVLSMATQVASKVPSPSGTSPNVATIEATTKLGKAARMERRLIENGLP